MAKKHISDFLHELYKKDVITKECLDYRIKWLDEHYDNICYEYTTNKEKLFMALVRSSQNLLLNLTFLDLCLDHGERGAIEAMILNPKGKKIFEDSLKILEIYFMQRVDLIKNSMK